MKDVELQRVLVGSVVKATEWMRKKLPFEKTLVISGIHVYLGYLPLELTFRHYRQTYLCYQDKSRRASLDQRFKPPISYFENGKEIKT